MWYISESAMEEGQGISVFSEDGMGSGDDCAFLGCQITPVASSPGMNTSFTATLDRSYTSSRLCGWGEVGLVDRCLRRGS